MGYRVREMLRQYWLEVLLVMTLVFLIIAMNYW